CGQVDVRNDITPVLQAVILAGERQAFRACVAAAVRAAHKDAPVSAVVLAQVSMAGAAPMLADLGVPVISAPQAALDRLRPAAP
ncbi:MAG: hypothetical protein ACO37E_02080, partial [Lutimaribacter sp.]